jgi:hypothetical protein
MRLGSLVCGLLISIIYFMDFLYHQRGLESRPCHEILYIYNVCAVLCFLYLNPSMEKSPPSLHATDNSTFTFTLYFKYFIRILCTFYLSTFCLQYILLLLKSFYCQLLLLLLKYKFKVI